jgi:hypothetical protein
LLLVVQGVLLEMVHLLTQLVVVVVLVEFLKELFYFLLDLILFLWVVVAHNLQTEPHLPFQTSQMSML